MTMINGNIASAALSQKAPPIDKDSQKLLTFKNQVFLDALSHRCHEEKVILYKLGEEFKKEGARIETALLTLNPQETKTLEKCIQGVSLGKLVDVFSEVKANKFWDKIIEEAQNQRHRRYSIYSTILHNENRRAQHEFSMSYSQSKKAEEIVRPIETFLKWVAQGTVDTLLEPRFYLANVGGFLVGRGIGSLLSKKIMKRPFTELMRGYANHGKKLAIYHGKLASESLSTGLIWGLSADKNHFDQGAKMATASLLTSFVPHAYILTFPRRGLGQLGFKSAAIRQGLKTVPMAMALGLIKVTDLDLGSEENQGEQEEKMSF